MDAWLHYKDHQSFLWRINFRFHQTSSARTFSDDSIERLSKRWNVEFLDLSFWIFHYEASTYLFKGSLNIVSRPPASYYKLRRISNFVISIHACMCIPTHFIEHREGNIKLKHISFSRNSNYDTMYRTKDEIHSTNIYIYIYVNRI